VKRDPSEVLRLTTETFWALKDCTPYYGPGNNAKIQYEAIEALERLIPQLKALCFDTLEKSQPDPTEDKP